MDAAFIFCAGFFDNGAKFGGGGRFTVYNAAGTFINKFFKSFNAVFLSGFALAFRFGIFFGFGFNGIESENKNGGTANFRNLCNELFEFFEFVFAHASERKILTDNTSSSAAESYFKSGISDSICRNVSGKTVGIKTGSAFGGNGNDFVKNGALALVVAAADKIAGKWNANSQMTANFFHIFKNHRAALPFFKFPLKAKKFISPFLRVMISSVPL